MSTTNPFQYFSTVKFPELRIDWWQGSEIGGETIRFLLPLLWGTGVTAVTWMLIYFDSAIPGINPKSPNLTVKEFLR